MTCGDQECEIKTIASTKERVACAVSNINIQPWGQIVYWINQEGSDPVLINKVGKISTFENITKPDKNGKIPIIIRNLSPVKQLIRKGSPICKLSPFEIIKELKNSKDLEGFIREDLETETLNFINEDSGDRKETPWKPSQKVKI